MRIGDMIITNEEEGAIEQLLGWLEVQFFQEEDKELAGVEDEKSRWF